MKRLVIVTNRRLDTIESGNGAYLRTFFDHALGLGFEITILCAPTTAFGNLPYARLAAAFEDKAAVVWPRAVKRRARWISTAPEIWVRSVARLALEPLRRAGLIRIPSLLGHVPGRRELADLAGAVARLKPDVLIVEYSSLGPLLALCPHVPKRGVLLHDLFSSRAAHFKAAGKRIDHVDITLAEEVERCAGATMLLHASHGEMALFAPHAPHQRHVWLAPGARVQRGALTPRETAFAAFFGVDHAGNRDAVDHLLADVWPRVRRLKGDAVLKIAGSICGPYADRPIPEGVELLGRIPSLSALAGPDAIGLAPTRVGSGVSIKVAEYLGLGMPVVAYPGGVEGFGDLLAGAVTLAETPDAFAAELVRLLEDRAARAQASAHGLDAAERTLTHDAITAALLDP